MYIKQESQPEEHIKQLGINWNKIYLSFNYNFFKDL